MRRVKNTLFLPLKVTCVRNSQAHAFKCIIFYTIRVVTSNEIIFEEILCFEAAAIILLTGNFFYMFTHLLKLYDFRHPEANETCSWFWTDFSHTRKCYPQMYRNVRRKRVMLTSSLSLRTQFWLFLIKMEFYRTDGRVKHPVI